jgi:hypothetical protein
MISYNIHLAYDSALRDEVVSDWIAGGLCENTLSKYQKGWSLWTQHIKAEGHGSNFYLDNVDREEFIKVVVLFIRGVCLGSNGSMSAMETAMSGVGSAFVRASKCTLLLHCDTIKLARKSSIKQTVAMQVYGSRNDKKLPMVLDMLIWLRNQFWLGRDWLTQVDSKITYLGAAVANDGLLRISEYALVRGANHMMRCKDVAIEVTGLLNPVQPGELRQALSVPGRSVRRIQLHIPKYRSKVVGSERKINLNWRGPTSSYGTQLVADFVEFCLHEGGTGDDPLFSRTRHGRTKLLNYDMVAKGVKASATACGLDHTVFSTHSCRSGGATAMCAAGWARTKIQQRGGWSELSDSDLIYAASLPSDSEGAREVTVDDIRWLQVFQNRSG